MMKRSVFLACLLVNILFLAACKKDKAGDSPQPGAPGLIPGMGDTPGQLTGTPFQLPAGIELEGNIIGAEDPEAPGYCRVAGSGPFVFVELHLVNHAQHDTLLMLPAGLVFHAENDAYQNGLLIRETPIPLARGASCKTMVLTYCVNENRHASDASCTYAFGPVTDAKPLQELIRLVKNKKINYEDFQDHDWDDILNLQDAVWEITDGEGLTKANRDYISGLPGM